MPFPNFKIWSVVSLLSLSALPACKQRKATDSNLEARESVYSEGAEPGEITAKFKVPKSVEDCEKMSLENHFQDPNNKMQQIVENANVVNMLPTPKDVYIDAHCSNLFMKKHDPDKKGVISIFGSSKLKEFHVAYHTLKKMVNQWTAKKTGISVLTATGPGLMEAGNCGVNDKPDPSMPSLGYATTFEVPEKLKDKFKSGSRAWEVNKCTSNGYIFRSFGMRESEMIDRARISVLAPGGVGTEWEIYEIISKIQTKKIPNNYGKGAPLVILFMAAEEPQESTPTAQTMQTAIAGVKKITPDQIQLLKEVSDQKTRMNLYWKSLFTRLVAMEAAGTILSHDLTLFRCGKTVDETLEMMSKFQPGVPLETSIGNLGSCEKELNDARKTLCSVEPTLNPELCKGSAEH
ncbi:MAG: LOG family protein [Proteobacteria bacterium]|nr:LOG family protein [Pseudomonadota bacterium]